MRHLFQALDVARRPARWRELVERFWAGYERWFTSRGDAARPDFVESRWALGRHMPELVPLWRRLVDEAAEVGDVDHDRFARFLALYRPAPYLSGCSQLAWVDDEPVLARNYDYTPGFWEGTLLRTDWAGRSVLALGDCLWGALDGINDAGLTVALAFGGRRVVGDGFGIPLILRYLLERCDDTDEAAAALRRLPSHMAYNVTVIDADGRIVSASLAPDRPPIVSRTPLATNHQEVRDWPEIVERTASVERALRLEALQAPLAAATASTRDDLLGAFFQPPLFADGYAQGFGTLYTSVYFPRRRRLELRWPGETLRFDLDGFREVERTLEFTTPGATIPPVGLQDRAEGVGFEPVGYGAPDPVV